MASTILEHGEVTIEDEGGEDYGTVAVRIAVDGEFDWVTLDLGQTGDVPALERAIESLQSGRTPTSSH